MPARCLPVFVREYRRHVAPAFFMTYGSDRRLAAANLRRRRNDRHAAVDVSAESPSAGLRRCPRYHATTMVAPNFAYDLCVQKISAEQRASLNLASVKVALCGAEPVRPDTLAQFGAAFGPCGFPKRDFPARLRPGGSHADRFWKFGRKSSFHSCRRGERVATESYPACSGGRRWHAPLDGLRENRAGT